MSIDSSKKNEFGAIQVSKELSPYEFNLLTTLAIVATFLVLSAIGGYAFNWTWTGFQGNHLWDWLKLLLIPVVLAGATLYFSTDRKWRREWTVALYVIAALLLVSVVGGYIFNWSWTGFQGNKLWDWFTLVLQPFGLAALSIFFGSTAKWREGFTLAIAVIVVFLLVSVVGSYAFNWSWTGFQGNHLWDWLKLLLLPVTLAVVSISFKGYERVWTVVIVAAAIFLLVAAVGGYVFNWSWTGFQGNRLWEWLELLLLPVALAAVKPALNRYGKQSIAVIVAAMVFLVVSAVGGYAFNWTWTGFQGNHLWDWLVLLLLPIGLAAAQIWFSSSRGKTSGST